MTQPATWQDKLQKDAPEVFKMVSGARESVLAEGALPLKIKILMTMLCDALLAHPDGVANIANRARAAGATEEEIAETVGVAFLFGGMPAVVTAANGAADALSRQATATAAKVTLDAIVSSSLVGLICNVPIPPPPTSQPG